MVLEDATSIISNIILASFAKIAIGNWFADSMKEALSSLLN